jgi:peptidoglycan/xylan/chitin deacetylase (PgdA/CDA1 family)
MYHGVRGGDRKINGRHVAASDFEKQLDYFRREFDIVPLHRLCEMKVQRIVPEKSTIALTFDDGFLNNFTVALPLLEKYQIPATFFICSASVRDPKYAHPTDIVDLIRVSSKPEKIRIGEFSLFRQGHQVVDDNGRHAYQYINELTYEKWLDVNTQLASQVDAGSADKNQELFRLVQDEDIKSIMGNGLMTIGSHSHHHISLTMLSPDEIREQLVQSSTVLSAYGPVEAMAFPYGSYNDQTVVIANELGYKYLIAGGHVDPPFEKDVFPRIGVLDGAGVPYTILMINNGFKRFGF